MKNLLSVCLVAFVTFLSSGQTPDEKSIRSYLEKSTGLNPIEGVWEIEFTQEFYHFDTLFDVKTVPDSGQVAIIKNNDGFTAYYLNGGNYNLDFVTTDVRGVYMYQNYFPLNTSFSKKQAVICTHGKMEYTYDLPEEYVINICGEKYLPNMRVVNNLRWKKIFPANQ